MIDKNNLIKMIVAQLSLDLSQAKQAANDAHAAAVDDQSVAETQYDTLAIEAGYLAEGQSKRVNEVEQAISAYNKLVLRKFTKDSQIRLTALVQLSADIDEHHWFFIGPAAGGFRCQLKQQQLELNVTVITPNAPMTLALLNKEPGDDIEIVLGNSKLTDVIASVC
jgi:transcription elongation GreA/GreB family factor